MKTGRDTDVWGRAQPSPQASDSPLFYPPGLKLLPWQIESNSHILKLGCQTPAGPCQLLPETISQFKAGSLWGALTLWLISCREIKKGEWVGRERLCALYMTSQWHRGALRPAPPKARNGTSLIGMALLPTVGCLNLTRLRISCAMCRGLVVCRTWTLHFLWSGCGMKFGIPLP